MPVIGILPGRKIFPIRLVGRAKKILIINVDSVPDTPIEVPHKLGHKPSFVIITPRDGPVIGHGVLVDTSPTSVKIKANVSGVNLSLMLIP